MSVTNTFAAFRHRHSQARSMRLLLFTIVLSFWTVHGTASIAATANQDIESLAPPAPDYAQAASWASGPAGPGAAGALPKGASPAAKKPAVDVFYVHPTTFRSDTQWNQDVGDSKANAWVDASVIARQASVFSACCRVWAPRYRAASYKSFSDTGHREAAFALAYADVERAFDWFLSHESHGRPFIIAGHSQGAKHIADLLAKRIDGTPLQNRLVAAYIIGINLAEGEFGLRYKHVRLCEKPAETGCALQWNAVKAGSNLNPVVSAYEKIFTDQYGDVPGRTTVCINPVTFDRSRPSSAFSEAKGAIPGDPGAGPMKPLIPKAVKVTCEKGFAVTEMDPRLGLEPLPGGGLHYHDFGLFYGDMRANAVLRTKAWLRNHK